MRLDTDHNTFYVSNPIGIAFRYPLSNFIEFLLTIHSIKYIKFIHDMILYAKVLRGCIFMKKFDEWNEIKKKTDKYHKKLFFKERDIFYTKLGENIGYEQNGKGDKFQRPVVVLKKYNQNFFLGVPLTSVPKTGKYYFAFSFKKDVTSYAILSQVRAFDKKRLMKKIGMIPKDKFEELKICIKDLL